MTRILLASTALVLCGVAAHADVTLSGDARMGVIKNFPPLGEVDNESLQFTSRARVKVDMSGTTDGGLNFGASFRINDAADANEGKAGEVLLSGSWGTITMGDVDGAALAAIDHVSPVGLTDLASLNEVRYIANGFEGTDPSVLYSYSTGNWTFYGSVVNPGSVLSEPIFNTFTPDPNDFNRVESQTGIQAYSIAARYAVENYAVAVGYETNKIVYGANLVVDQTNLMLGLEGTFENLRVQGIVGRFKGSDVAFSFTDISNIGAVQVNDLSGTQYAVSADYTMDALTLTAFYTDDSGYDGTQAYGVGASYDLGGGALVKGGYVKDNADGASSYDLGVQMSF